MAAANLPGDGPDADELTAAITVARGLLGRQGLDATAAALVAVLDALDRRGWPAVPLDSLIAAAGATIDGAQVSAGVAALEEAGVIVQTSAGFVLDASVRAALRGARPGPRFTSGRDDAHGLAAQLADAGAVVVVTGGSAEDRRVAIERAGPVRWADPGDPADLDAKLRAAWFGEEILAIDAGATALDWIGEVAAVPLRIAIAIAGRRAGEALARLRAARPARSWMVALAAPASRPPLPPELEALAASTWDGVRLAGAAGRVVLLDGTAAEVDAAAGSIAAHHARPLRRIDLTRPGGLAEARDALRAEDVVRIAGAARSGDELALHVLAGLVAASGSIVLFVRDPDHALPPALASLVEVSVACGGPG